MTETTIASVVAGQPLAVCPEHGASVLCRHMPTAEEDFASVEMASLSVGRGERFAIGRGMALVPVRGLLTVNNPFLERYLGWTTYQGLVETMELLRASDEVNGVAMVFDTPGGLVLGMEAAVEAITATAAVKPVHALVNPLAASAGYWLACQATEIISTAGSLVGSIGVMTSASAPIGPGAGGHQWYDLRSSHAQAKNPDASTDEGRALIQMQLDKSEARFLDAIAAGRKIDRDELASRLALTDDARTGGATFGPIEAVERGLVDGVETATAFFDRIGALYAPAKRPGAQALMARAQAAQAIAQT